MLQCDIQRPFRCSEWPVICPAVQTMYQKALFAEPGYLCGQAPSHTFWVNFWWLKKCCLPYCHLKVASVHIFCECFSSWWNGTEFHWWCTTLPCFWAPHFDPAFCHGIAWLCYLAICSTHELSGLCLNIFNLSMHITNAEEWETPLLGNFDNHCLAYAMQWRYCICTRESVNC